VDPDPIEQMAAELEIRNVLARLAHLADDGDLEEYLDNFTEDATWANPGSDQVRRGREDLLAGALERRASGIQGPGSGTRHVLTTTAVEVLDSGRATARSYFLFLDTNDDGGAVIRLTGRYLDDFRRTPMGWKLAGRRIVTDVNS
jgi:3-phenylpropionate/cinnamic acid dioxygenase small subunit